MSKKTKQIQEIVCPWCSDPKSEESPIIDEGVMHCCKCSKHFVWQRHVEYSYTTQKIKFCPKET